MCVINDQCTMLIDFLLSKYLDILETGGLFMLGIRLLQLFSVEKQDFRPLVSKLGLLFQIRDDLLNLTAPQVYAVFSKANHYAQLLFVCYC